MEQVISMEYSYVAPVVKTLLYELNKEKALGLGPPDEAVVAALLASYAAARGTFSRAEAAAFRGLVYANALACALYRFYAFHVADPNAPEGARRSYREMHAVCLALEDAAVGARVDALAHAAVTP